METSLDMFTGSYSSLAQKARSKRAAISISRKLTSGYRTTSITFSLSYMDGDRVESHGTGLVFFSHRQESDERTPPEQIAWDQIISERSNVDWTVGIITILSV